MRFQQVLLHLSALLAGTYAFPNEMPEEFKREILAVGGNCNFTGACAQANGFDPGECIGESASRCCLARTANRCNGAGNACEFDPEGGLARCT
ncbi:hypothetical protein NKR19_g4568 [Coniochaeta hoffmannii]|uniref:Uncharacterized protein n=1 Tax=Coniochaeta hoffmannii TaxID=91930 RepID=A0AA38RX41_9PEZI|nr:hypothetical protein NKR19_g4568 [Coniochaeta hoffmannii]